ncbi:hypothetical protein [Leekyejoonella antrihumi]|uniref:Helix-turn-helix domain-containing protein n=1 Tax=Leekyejoonella antrihumi TaxID=1660198 RepID=A0A563DQH0_9MICO|nr:hypothetical protein [Leekyejoonella antrihumi]TWP32470.1 hypothetical protein FGL98_24140 [Leekyejoonella antrihumi]
MSRSCGAGPAGTVRRVWCAAGAAGGRPPGLSTRQVTQAREWAGQGWTQQAIADRLGVAQSVISELLARLGPLPVQDVLPEDAGDLAEGDVDTGGSGAPTTTPAC